MTSFFSSLCDSIAAKPSQATLTLILAQNHLLILKAESIMASIADVQAALAANESREATIIGLLQTEAATLKDTQAQLAAALAGTDPAALQAVADKMAADSAAMDAAIASITVPGVGVSTVSGGASTVSGA